MSIIFLVSSGSYSDYSVHAAFSTKEKAEKFISRFKELTYDPYEIEERDIDPAEEFVNQGLIPMRVFIDREGSTSTDQMDSMYSIPLATEQALLKNTYQGKSMLRVEGWFKSSEHAVKVANERRTILIANGEWP